MKKTRYSFDFESIKDSWDNVLIYDIETAETLQELENAVATGSKELLNPLQAKHFAFATKKSNLMKANRNIHKLLATYEKQSYKSYYIYLKMNVDAEQMAKDLITLAEGLNLHLLAHAGLHFDFLIFKTLLQKKQLSYMERKGNYFLRKGKRLYRLIDTFLLTRTSLEKSLQAFNINMQKDYSTDLKAYLLHDIEMTIELVEALRQSGIAYTVTRSARRFYNQIAERYGVTGIDTYLPENMSLEYSGGRVQVWKAWASNVNVYDINSLYPFAMARFLYPRMEKNGERLLMNVHRYQKETFMKMIEALRTPVHSYMLNDARQLKELFEVVGIYPYCRVKIKAIHPAFEDMADVIQRYFPFSVIRNGRRAYMLDTEAIYHIQGYETLFLSFFEFELLDVYIASAERLFFANDIEALYEQRKLAKATGNALESQRLKAILVNLYGVYGLRQERSYEDVFSLDERELLEMKIASFTEGSIMHLDHLTALKLSGKDAKATLLLAEDRYILTMHERTFAKHMSAPLIATAVTSNGRFWLLTNIYYIAVTLEANVFYCDTDSVFTDAELESSDRLGSFKHEYTATKAFFFAPKTYIALAEKPILKAKGTGRKLVTEAVIQSFKTEHQIIRKLAIAPERKINALMDEEGWLYYCKEEQAYINVYRHVFEKALAEIEDEQTRKQLQELINAFED